MRGFANGHDMTPEEREKFRQEWRQRCGRWGRYNWEEKKTEEQAANSEL